MGPDEARRAAPKAVPARKKESSFVVLRGAKGDAALTERRPSAASSSSSSRAPSAPVSPPFAQTHQQRNSLLGTTAGVEREGRAMGPAPTTMATAAAAQEDWELSLNAERDREEQSLRLLQQQQQHVPRSVSASSSAGARASPPSSASSGHIHGPIGSPVSRNRRTSVASLDALTTAANDDEESEQLRRRASLALKSATNSLADDDAAAAAAAAAWGGTTLTRGTGSLGRRGALHGASSNPSVRPLGHSNSLSSATYIPRSSASAGPGAAGALSHSLSLSAQHQRSVGVRHSPSAISVSSGGGSGPLSPVGAIGGPSPWSPTAQEALELRRTSMSSATRPSLVRGGSSSDGSLGPLTTDLGELDLAEQQPPPPPRSALSLQTGLSHEEDAALALPGSQPPSSSTPRARLAPLVTDSSALVGLSTSSEVPGINSQAAMRAEGPKTAAAYVPEIGHSRREGSEQVALKPPFSTAGPGQGAQDWLRQKEYITGTTPPPFLPPQPMHMPPPQHRMAPEQHHEWGMSLAMQQQQQIQQLQAQLQQTMHAMDTLHSRVPHNAGQHPPPMSAPSYAPSPAPYSGHSMPPLMPAMMPHDMYQQPQYGLGPAAFVPDVMPRSSSRTPPPPASIEAIRSLVGQKGYNPPSFDMQPQGVRSQSRLSVHADPCCRHASLSSRATLKRTCSRCVNLRRCSDVAADTASPQSLKHEIWASTDLGNKRLNRAYKENAGKGPIFLFFSVNGSCVTSPPALRGCMSR